MNWLHFSLITIVLYGLHDITLKHLAGKVDSTLASVVINGSAAIVLLAFLLIKTRNNVALKLDGSHLALLVIGGLFLGVATITFMNAFDRDGKLSIAVPVVYAGVITLCALVGILFFKETLDWRQWAGAVLAVAGIALMSKS